MPFSHDFLSWRSVLEQKEKQMKTDEKMARDCPNCVFDTGSDCSNPKWHRSAEKGLRTDNKKGECLFFCKSEEK